MSTVEYGIFNDEGCIGAGWYSREEVEKFLAALRDRGEVGADDDEHVAEVCTEHEEYEADTCEECFGEDDEDES